MAQLGKKCFKASLNLQRQKDVFKWIARVLLGAFDDDNNQANCRLSQLVRSAKSRQRRHDQLRVSDGKLEIEMNEYGISNDIYS